MEHYNILRGLAEGKKCFMVTKDETSYFVLGKSVFQVSRRFSRKWNVQEISVSEYVQQKLAYE